MRQYNADSSIENLEARTLLSSATLHNGILRVVGDGWLANTIIVAESPDGASVNVTVNSTNGRNVNRSLTKTFAKPLVINEIHVRGGGKNDLISVGQENSALLIDRLDLPARVLGLGGNDAIATAGGADVIFAGSGNDAVGAGDGDDRIRGEAGDDLLDGAGGNDRINAGFGNDTAGGGTGDDVLRGEAGNDLLGGGEGNDLVFGGFGNDMVRGEAGDDHLWGGPGDDNLNGGAGDDTLGGILGTNTLLGEQGRDTFNVRDLAFNPGSDYNATEDVLTIVPSRREGPTPPVI